jgi:HlyD family secretion protein
VATSITDGDPSPIRGKREKQGALDKARAEHCTITSLTGLLPRSVDVGQTVAASLQAPVIFAIANDLTKMQIDANVAEADVGW